jgi:hypothetical protein
LWLLEVLERVSHDRLSLDRLELFGLLDLLHPGTDTAGEHDGNGVGGESPSFLLEVWPSSG